MTTIGPPQTLEDVVARARESQRDLLLRMDELEKQMRVLTRSTDAVSDVLHKILVELVKRRESTQGR